MLFLLTKIQNVSETTKEHAKLPKNTLNSYFKQTVPYLRVSTNFLTRLCKAISNIPLYAAGCPTLICFFFLLFVLE